MLSYYSAIRLKGFCTECHSPDGKVGNIANLHAGKLLTTARSGSPAMPDPAGSDVALRIQPLANRVRIAGGSAEMMFSRGLLY